MDVDIEHFDRECDEVGIDNDIECDETIEQPTVGMNFSSVEQVLSYHMKYGKQKDFRVCKRNSRQDDDGNIRWICLACVRGDTSKSKAANVMKPRQTEKIGCMARINAILNNEGGYTLSKVILDHTHVCSLRKARHFRCFKKVDPRVAKRLEINDEAGIRLSKNFKVVVVEAGDARSRAAYESFGDVITFDTTYLTNVYKMPFAPFVGVNHHGQSILFGCGLISNEDANTFEWLFESWLKCMNDQPPKAIITDQDKAMKITISRVFPTSRHRFCLWRIMKKLPEKFGSHSQYEEIKSTLHKYVYDSFSETEFESHWHDMLDTYDLHENAWLVSLYSDRRFWVPAYVKDTFWAGMSTTQQSESMNIFFDDYINSKTTLKQFVDQYDSALRRKVENEAIADFNSFNTEIPCIGRYPLEKQFQKAYTIAKFKEVQEELRGFLYLTTSLVGCESGRNTFVVADEVQVGDDLLKRATFTVKVDEDPLDAESSTLKLISQIEQLKVQYPGTPDPATSMGGTTVHPATSMGDMTDRVLSPLRSSHAPDECIVRGTHHEAPQSQVRIILALDGLLFPHR
ncbi:protein FAR-RED IMPAIRED RESPONSE 1-like [Juglans regia]|uniref:Protein FAR1-RELATED SEQUENCE n=1 Tax=Juglans regia TaxID=51240 RepID=A0A6P9F8Y2_JUGRE|nr:protein FAR-RED IMPAIRED RESPONSE 1-like [Juglans regia]